MRGINFEEEIITLLCDLFSFDSCNLSLENRLRDDLYLDSINMVCLQVALEDKFQFRFDPNVDNFFEIFYTVGSLVEHIKKFED